MKTQNWLFKLQRFAAFFLINVILLTQQVFAAANFGEKAGDWLLEQIVWIGLIVVVIVLIKLLLARNYTALLVTALVSGVTLYIIANPANLQTLGETVWTTVFTG